MSGLALSLAFENFDFATTGRRPIDALRLVLMPGELIRLPAKARSLKINSGRAWLSIGGIDYDLASGESVELEASKYPALISESAGGSLYIEVR